MINYFRDAEASAKLSLHRKFFDEKWSKNRCVTCMDWSTQVSKINSFHRVIVYLCIIKFWVRCIPDQIPIKCTIEHGRLVTFSLAVIRNVVMKYKINCISMYHPLTSNISYCFPSNAPGWISIEWKIFSCNPFLAGELGFVLINIRALHFLLMFS